MKIAQIAPIVERVPPKTYGGTERVVQVLTEELVRRGHNVTLFATGDSLTSAKLSSVYPRALREAEVHDMYGTTPWTMYHIGTAYDQAGDFDIIHDHTGFIGTAIANLSPTPVIATCHGPFTDENTEIYRGLRGPHLVTISDAQASVPGLNYAGTVYNGLELEPYPFSAQHDGYLLFVGRISPEKGVHHAIEVAKRTNLPLIIAAKLESYDQKYFTESIEPHLSEQIRWIGEVNEGERNRLMSRALCFVHAATWPEPFGLTLIEAMACGAPVLGTRMGSLPEIIENGKTGFTVDTVDEMVEALGRIHEIDRAACREHVLSKFTGKHMADGYLKIYDQVLTAQKST